MNVLLTEIKRSLVELGLGLSGDLTMTGPMEQLMNSLAEDKVPASWIVVAYPSLRPLQSWFTNLLQRIQQLVEWTTDLQVRVLLVCKLTASCAGFSRLLALHSIT